MKMELPLSAEGIDQICERTQEYLAKTGMSQREALAGLLSIENVLIMAFLISYTCVLFLPSMHERYGFIYEILGLMLAFWFVKTIPLLVLMYFTSIATYSNYLFQLSTNSTVLCVINTLVYVAYVVYLSRQLFKEKEEAAPVLQDKKA